MFNIKKRKEMHIDLNVKLIPRQEKPLTRKLNYLKITNTRPNKMFAMSRPGIMTI